MMALYRFVKMEILNAYEKPITYKCRKKHRLIEIFIFSTKKGVVGHTGNRGASFISL
jgi:hypothetical protein